MIGKKAIETRSQGRQGGFSLLELVIVVILVVLLFLVAQDRLLPLRGDAEGTRVASVIGSMRSALGMEFASRVTRNGIESVADMQGINPMTLLQKRPDRYLGQRSGSDPGDVPGGAWFFEPDSRALVYRVRFPQYLAGKPEPPVNLRWRVKLLFDDTNGNGQFDPESDQLRGVQLVHLDSLHWPDLPLGGMADAVSGPP